MIVWALFDSETCTVAKALLKHKVYSFGIGNGTRHINLDLSDFQKAKLELDKYPRPDVIFASPPCESWVRLSVGVKRHFTKAKGLNYHWRKRWVPFDFLESGKKTRLNGVNTALTLARIILHYKPKFWAVENGASSLMFDFIEDFTRLKGHRNQCNYASFGFNVLKPTIIYSNVLLELKREKIKALFCIRRKVKDHYKGMTEKQIYIERSKVPCELYQDIMRQFCRYRFY